MRIVMTSCPEASVASLVEPILQEHLAGCIQAIAGVTSTYRWQGQIHRDNEHLLLFKTPVDRVDALVTRLTVLHPYEVPEVAVLEVESILPSYGLWLHDVTRADART